MCQSSGITASSSQVKEKKRKEKKRKGKIKAYQSRRQY
jgi:hypothetical protein